MDLSNWRQDYQADALERDELCLDPFEQFEAWFTTACDRAVMEPNAMSLATVSAQGRPSQRTVLLKSFDRQGFVFFTNYSSRKAQEIGANSWVSLLFVWLPLQRQVEISGQAQKVSSLESLRYFATRPRGSQLGAWCSAQSSVVASRQLLEHQLEVMQQKFANREIPLPDFWGGYRVVPERFEFWQGRSNRLHDRFEYRRSQPLSIQTLTTPTSPSPASPSPTSPSPEPAPTASWQIQRLAP